jgi:hypothetical protein
MLRRTNHERTTHDYEPILYRRLNILGTQVSFGGCQTRPLACLGTFATVKEEGIKRVPIGNLNYVVAPLTCVYDLLSIYAAYMPYAINYS